jgi:5-enolpyruvylshikimate-3-phosphate synthase
MLLFDKCPKAEMLMSAPNKLSLFPLEAFIPSPESNSIRGYQLDTHERDDMIKEENFSSPFCKGAISCTPTHSLLSDLEVEIKEVITLLKSNFFLIHPLRNLKQFGVKFTKVGNSGYFYPSTAT